ncbi:hypothetical protein JCM5296_002470 [Sporobolomyces johnsonii]
MLQSARSRQLWGFLVITVLPGSSSLPSFLLPPPPQLTFPSAPPVRAASAYLGYYLRDSEDAKIAATAPSPALDERILQDKITMLRRREVLLADEERDLGDKLARLRAAKDRADTVV